MRESILAGVLISLLPAFALAAVMPDHRSGIPAALSAIPANPDHMAAPRVDLVNDQVKPIRGILVNLRSTMQAPESRILLQPREHNEPQAKTNDARIEPATRVHIYWFFGGR